MNKEIDCTYLVSSLPEQTEKKEKKSLLKRWLTTFSLPGAEDLSKIR